MLKKTVSSRVYWRLFLFGWMGWEHVPVKRCITRRLNIRVSWYRKESEKMQGSVYVLFAAHVNSIVLWRWYVEKSNDENMGWAARGTDTRSVNSTWWVACHDTRVWVCLFVTQVRVVNSIRDMRFQFNLFLMMMLCCEHGCNNRKRAEICTAKHDLWLQLRARKIMI